MFIQAAVLLTSSSTLQPCFNSKCRYFPLGFKGKRWKRIGHCCHSQRRSWRADCGKNKVGGGGVWQPLSPSVIKSKSLSSCLSSRPPAKPPTAAISPGPCVPFNHVCVLDYCGWASLHMLGARVGWGAEWERKRLMKSARKNEKTCSCTIEQCRPAQIQCCKLYLAHTWKAWYTNRPVI